MEQAVAPEGGPVRPPRGDSASRAAEFIARNAWGMLLAGLALVALCVPPAVRLYRDLQTDLRELLPKGAPAAVALAELEKRLGGLSQLSLVIQTDDPAAGRRFVDALSEKLRALPPEVVRFVRADVRAEKEFFTRHGALFASTAELETATRELSKAVGAQNPLAVQLDDDEAAPSAALPQEFLDKLAEAFDQTDRFPGGYLSDPSGHTFIVLVSPPGSSVSVDTDKTVFEAVDAQVRALNPAAFHPSLKVGYGGEIKEVLETQAALVHDIVVSTALVFLAVGAVLLLYFGTWWCLPLLGVPLLMGVIVTFAISRGVIHALNPNTAFLGSIIIGNGINAGIILLARYFEERRRMAAGAALAEALRGTWVATLAASGAAAASYGSLIVTGFRGFNQFGFLGVVGMLLCWLATYTFTPALIMLLERRRPFVPVRVPRGLALRLAHALSARARGTLVVCIVVSGLSAFAVSRFLPDPFEYDFDKLGSRQGEKNGAAYFNAHMDRVLKEHQSPQVILLDTPEQARVAAAALEQDARQDPTHLTAAVHSLQQLVPDDQPRRVELLKKLFAQLTPGVLRRVPEKNRGAVERILHGTELRPFTLDEVPLSLRRVFVERDGSSGKLVFVTPSLEHASKNAGRQQMTWARRVREVAVRAVPSARVAGSIILTSDIVSSITEDGLFSAGLSLLAVILLTLLALRSVRHAGWVIGSLLLGVLWLGALLQLFAMKLNFVNFVVLPITFGIGADYAVNLYQRYRQLGPGSAPQAVAASGWAVALCSATTIIGYAALLVADNRAIFSFGAAAVLGEITCLTAALVALPAALVIRDGERRAAPRS